jgi:hypothetical protein
VLADQVQRDNGSIGVAPFKRLKQPRKGEPRPSKLENTRELQVARERADIVRGKLSVCRCCYVCLLPDVLADSYQTNT